MTGVRIHMARYILSETYTRMHHVHIWRARRRQLERALHGASRGALHGALHGACVAWCVARCVAWCVAWCIAGHVAESGTLSRNISSRRAHAARGCRCCGSLDGTCLASPSIGSEIISGHSSDRKGRLRRVSKVPKPSSSRTLLSTGLPRSPTSSPRPPSPPPPPPPSPPPPLRVEVVVVLRAVRTVPASSVKSGSCHSK